MHKEDGSINYTGSSNAMEVEAAKRLWGRSLALGLVYTGLVGDGDSKAYQAVVRLEPYGPDTEILKEECINHAHKRKARSSVGVAKVGSPRTRYKRYKIQETLFNVGLYTETLAQ